MSGNVKYRFNFPGTRALIGSQLKFYNAGNDFYYAVWTQKNAVLLSVSSNKAKNFSDPKEILQINHDLVDVQFIAIKEKFAVAITEKLRTLQLSGQLTEILMLHLVILLLQNVQSVMYLRKE